MLQEKSDSRPAGAPKRRRYPRNVLPRLTLRFEGHNYTTTDSSVGDFRISSFHRPLRPREKLEGHVVTSGGLKREAFEAEVVRLNPDGGVSCRFLTPIKAVLRA